MDGAVRLPAEKVAAVRQAILEWYRRGHRDLPWRRTRDPYAILVSEIMLQQTQVDRVIPKYHQFLEWYPTLAALAAAPRAEVIRNWSPLGYNLRAVRLHEIARQAVERFGGRLPDTVEGLLSLNGIGPYTAGAVACFAFGQSEPALDTNVRRALGRIFAADVPGAGRDDRLAWQLAA
ncbi:MAG: A/G-specific adenine glycosylase, partial [Chloroflexota bacterium]